MKLSCGLSPTWGNLLAFSFAFRLPLKFLGGYWMRFSWIQRPLTEKFSSWESQLITLWSARNVQRAFEGEQCSLSNIAAISWRSVLQDDLTAKRHSLHTDEQSSILSESTGFPGKRTENGWSCLDSVAVSTANLADCLLIVWLRRRCCLWNTPSSRTEHRQAVKISLPKCYFRRFSRFLCKICRL